VLLLFSFHFFVSLFVFVSCFLITVFFKAETSSPVASLRYFQGSISNAHAKRWCYCWQSLEEEKVSFNESVDMQKSVHVAGQ